MLTVPSPPDVPQSHRASGPVEVRYEDIAQDGRVKVSALPHALGMVAWRKLVAEHPMSTAMRDAGVVPILSRLVCEGGGGPVSVRRALESEACYQMAQVPASHGGDAKIVLALHADVFGSVGRTHGPPPGNLGERIRVGRVFAEHVLTRLFAPAAERRVVTLPDGSRPETAHAWVPGEVIAAVPDGARPIDAEPAVDPTRIALGVDHTDSNQHVNSLVYPQLFADAALRRFEVHGRGTALLARFVDLRFRKPSFAGEVLRARVRAFEVDGKLGAAGVLFADGEDKPRVYGRVVFEP
jgi:acyl-CoA thioesterase FadM